MNIYKCEHKDMNGALCLMAATFVLLDVDEMGCPRYDHPYEFVCNDHTRELNGSSLVYASINNYLAENSV